MNQQPVPAGSITVRIDGSACAGLALDWAVAEATRRRLPLHIIHAFSYQYPMTSQGGMGFVLEGVREIAEDLCQKAEDRVQTTHPDLPVTWEVSTYGAASALVDASQTSYTVVVGARGVSAARGVLLGSVSAQVAAHSHCPVVVIHDGQPAAAHDAPVVVGVDGSAL